MAIPDHKGNGFLLFFCLFPRSVNTLFPLRSPLSSYLFSAAFDDVMIFFSFFIKLYLMAKFFPSPNSFFFSVRLVSASEPFFLFVSLSFSRYFFYGIFPGFVMLPFDNKKVSPVSWISIGSSLGSV